MFSKYSILPCSVDLIQQNSLKQEVTAQKLHLADCCSLGLFKSLIFSKHITNKCGSLEKREQMSRTLIDFLYTQTRKLLDTLITDYLYSCFDMIKMKYFICFPRLVPKHFIRDYSCDSTIELSVISLK